jgi:hypothetical protein
MNFRSTGKEIEEKHLIGFFSFGFLFGFAFGALVAIVNFFNAID